MLKLMYITNRPEVAAAAESAGVDRIFVDLEFIGKEERQRGLDTVKSHHTVADVAAVKAAVKKAQVLVRVNPIHGELPDYYSSADEIDAVVKAGADIIMLPYFKTAEEVGAFVRMVNGRARTMLLFETPEAVAIADDIIRIEGVDEVHIGLNDLSLGYGMSFMFEPLANGTVEQLCIKFRKRGIPFGIGGVASLGKGMLPAQYVIKEHYRLGSGCVILSRSFCNAEKLTSIALIKEVLTRGVREIRALERECEEHARFFFDNERELVRLVEEISKGADE
ncbi:MAG: aldolase [Clostridia bacterium]|nr:aldolase [Clostridia bacterium]MBQ4342212.1 aldolase [Clostridia bacterium]